MSGFAAGKGIGARLPRKEDPRHLHGRGSFVGDISMPGLMEVAFLRSPLAHARIRSIGVPQELAGQVFTAADLASSAAPIRTPSAVEGAKSADYPLLAAGKVRMVGEPIAMCVAATRAAAEDLCERVTLDLEELPAVVDALEARKPGAALVHEHWGDNVFLKSTTGTGFEEQVKQAEVVVKRNYRLARNCASPMEGKGTLAYWDSRADQLVVYSSTQVPHVVRSAIAICLGIDEGRVRVIAPDLGGGFGYKSVLQPEEITLAWLALKLKRPVRWTEDRREHLTAAANAREHYYEVTAYADKRGRLLAMDVELTISVGAYSVWPVSAGLEATHARVNLGGQYRMAGFRCNIYSVATNKPPMTPYRGVAKPSLGMAMELTMDAVARAVGREPAEVRLDNLVPPEAMPFTTVTGLHYDSGDYPRCVRTAVEQIGLRAVRARQKHGEADGRLIGIGVSSYSETTALGTRNFARKGWPAVPNFEQATLRLTPDGGLEVRVGVQSPGVGLETTLAQVAHEVLGIDTDRIQVVHGDTALTPYSTGTYNSRCMVMAGGAVLRSAKALAERLRRLGAHLQKCRPDEVKLEPALIRDIAIAWHHKAELFPRDVDVSSLEVTEGYKAAVDSGAVSYGAHAAVVALDPELGSVEILDYVIVEDCGRMVNPMIVEGQAYGGAAQGIGQALYEEMPYDAAGQPLASTLADYLLPGPTEVPRIRVFHTESPSPYTELGIKGVGEGGTIGAVSTVLCAINDALAALGAEVNEAPATPRRILEAIEAASAPRLRRTPERQAQGL
jgi:carbon-monoxide dehydrogenase large subunit